MAKKTKAAKADTAGTATATLRHIRLSARKARLVLNLVKGKQIEPALQILQFSPKKGAALLITLLNSAVANARETAGLDVDKLWITAGWVNEGRTMKRFMPRARGSADQIRKRSSHITVVLGEKR